MKDRDMVCFTSDQAKCIYKRVEKDNLINIENIKPQIKEYRLDTENDSEEKIHTRLQL